MNLMQLIRKLLFNRIKIKIYKFYEKKGLLKKKTNKRSVLKYEISNKDQDSVYWRRKNSR